MLRLLDDIALRLATDPDALALLALGSAGRSTERFDEHSDLDFFVIATVKEKFLADLSWLGPVQWSHRDTPDGCKALVAGVFCEFAVFVADEMPTVMYTAGSVVWQRGTLTLDGEHVPPERSREWLVDEVLSNLYVGLHRLLRGEHLSALRMVQGEALDNLLRLQGRDDPFAPSRRAEACGLPLAMMAPGYVATPAAAQVILDHLPAGGGVMRSEVEGLLQRAL